MKLFDLVQDFCVETNIESSSIPQDIKKRVLNCLNNDGDLLKEIRHLDKRRISNPGWEIDYTKRDIIVKTNDIEYSILEFCRARGISPYFRDTGIFQSNDCIAPKFIEYNSKVANKSVLLASLGHEAGHCLYYKYYKGHGLNLKELTARYGSCELLKEVIEKGVPALEGFSSVEEFANFMDINTISWTEKKTDYLVNRERLLSEFGANAFQKS